MNRWAKHSRFKPKLAWIYLKIMNPSILLGYFFGGLNALRPSDVTHGWGAFHSNDPEREN